MLIVLVGAVLLGGCATPGITTNFHHDADSYNVSNEKYVDTKPGIVWDNLVKELSKSYFMINNIDKESRIINVSFASDAVSSYVDCGDVEIRVKKSTLNKTGKELYKFDICDAVDNIIVEGSSPNSGGVMAPIIVTGKRVPSLKGRMNIYIAPQGGGTLVTVNCRYIITIELSQHQKFYAPIGNLVGTREHRDSYTCSLDSKNAHLCRPIKGDSFMCHATGLLEKEILSLVK